MSKLTVTEAVKVVPVSQATLYRDLKKGKVSFETNGKDRRLIDISELERAYGKLKTPAQSENGSENTAETINDNSQTLSLTNNDNQKIIALLETQVTDLKDQIADMKSQLTESTTEKNKLLDLANSLQKQNELLMLPSPKKKPGFWGYLRLKR